MEQDQNSASLESQKEIKSPRDEHKRWMMAIDLAGKEEKDWRKSALEAIRRYRDESLQQGQPNKRTNNQFNILWSNVEILRPNLYNQTPKPDVRRRYKDADPLGKHAAEILERGLAYTVDAYDFDHAMDLAVMDYLLPGRPVTRVRYLPVIQEKEGLEQKVYEEVECEHVQWDRFRRGPGSVWEEVPWIAFEHLLSRDELVSKYGEIGKEVELDVELDDGKEGDRPEGSDVWLRGRVWELWDKTERQVIHLAPTYDAKPLLVEADELGLEGFFPVPRPMYAVETSNSLVPIEEYRLYRDQARELDDITGRIQKIVNALKVRGLYDSALKELSDLMRADDDDILPVTNSRQLLSNGQKLEDFIWWMPVEQLAKVLQVLYEQREAVKNTIYEIIGIADIMRGAVDPNEKLGQSQIKSQSASIRLRRRQKEVARYARDLLRLKAEIISEHFSPETLQVMTGLPVNEEVMVLLRNDKARGFRIDIETDSTVQSDELHDQEAVSNMLNGIATFVSSVGPAVEAGYFPPDAAKSLLVGFARKFRLGREVEDKLDELAQPEQQQPDPMAEQALAAEQQAAQQAMQMEAQEKQARLQLDGRKQEIEAQYKQGELSLRARDQALKEAQFEHQKQMDAVKAQTEYAKLEDGAVARMEAQSGQDAATRDGVMTVFQEEMDGDMKEMAEAITLLAETMAANNQSLVDAQQQTTEAIQGMAEAMNAPKELVKDAQGRPVGVRVVTNA